MLSQVEIDTKRTTMKLKIGLSLLFLGFITIATAQNSQVLKAKNAFASEAFCEAQDLGEKAYNSLTRKGKMALKLKGEMATLVGDSYRFTEEYRPAHDWYERAIILEYYEHVPEVYLYNAEMLRMMTEYDKAKEMYNEYLKLVPESDLAQVGLKSCEMNKEFIANKTRHVIANQTHINTQEFDMATAVGDRKGVKIYFGSSRPDGVGSETDLRTCETRMDLWVSELDKKGEWTKPYLLKEDKEGTINTIDNEGTICFDSRYKTMFFTRCPVEKKMYLGCEIWMSEAQGKEEWKEPIELEGLKPNDTVSIGHPATIDGKFLVFVSDQAGGYGGKDLWYSEYNRKSESWSAPVNLGPEINTKGDELFPTFGLDGSLIFATDGRAGLGGLDIFKAKRVGEENKWTDPQHMGAPLNSASNDYHLIEVDERNGYFTSERKSVHGEYNVDIFSYNIPPFLYSLKVNVHELGKTTPIEDVRVVVTGSNAGETWEGYTDETGAVFWDRRPTEDPTFGDRYINEETSYTINIFGDPKKYHEEKKGQKISTVDLNYPQDFVVDMPLLPKTPLRLPEVRYPLDKWDLLVDSTFNSKDSLLYVYKMLEEFPGLVLQLNSHTDSRGSAARNEKLATNRARACYKFLVEEKGVDPRRIKPVGKGESTPRTVYLKDGVYHVDRPKDEDISDYEVIELTESYINKFRGDRTKFEMLHQLNRRTDAEVITLEFDPETAPAADPEWLKYVRYP